MILEIRVALVAFADLHFIIAIQTLQGLLRNVNASGKVEGKQQEDTL